MAAPRQTIFVGQVFPTKSHGNIEVIKYENSNNVTIQFDDGTTKVTNTCQIRKGLVKNNFKPIIYGVGYVGTDFYQKNKIRIGKTPSYIAWASMIRRCYSGEPQFEQYTGCTVDTEWHNFSVFDVWYNSQKNCDKGWQVDKDLTVLGNKTYSKHTCSLVPGEVNNLLLNRRSRRGECPLGVHWSDPHGAYIAQCHHGKSNTYLGIFDTAELAFQAYKVVKEKYIKVVANKYKDDLSTTVYNNLMSYEVHITD